MSKIAPSNDKKMKETRTYKTDEQAQHLILKIRLAVATGRVDMLPELNANLKLYIKNKNI